MNESWGYYRGKMPLDETNREVICDGPGIDLGARTPAEAKQRGFTGDPCPTCGGLHMVMAGHCQVCTECGTTTGCS